MFKICENTFVFAFHLSRVGCYFDGSPQICMRSSAGSDKDWIRGQAYSELIHELSPSKVKSVIRQIEKNLLLKKSRRPEKRSKRLCSWLPALIDTPADL